MKMDINEKSKIECVTGRVKEIVKDLNTVCWAGNRLGQSGAMTRDMIPDAVKTTIGSSNVWSQSESGLLSEAKAFCDKHVRQNKHARMQKWLSGNRVNNKDASYELMMLNAALVEALQLLLALETVESIDDKQMRWLWVDSWFDSYEWGQLYRESINKLRSIKGMQELGGDRTREKTGTMTLHSYKGGLYEIVVKSDESGYVCREYAREYELEDKLRHMSSVMMGKMEPVTNGGLV